MEIQEQKLLQNKIKISDIYNIEYTIKKYDSDDDYHNDYQNIICELIKINNNETFEICLQKLKYVQNVIFKHTKNIPEFKMLYQLASARLFSTKLKCGITILFSYDYLPYFHYCLQTYFLNGSKSFNERCKSYIMCYNVLRPKKPIPFVDDIMPDYNDISICNNNFDNNLEKTIDEKIIDENTVIKKIGL